MPLADGGDGTLSVLLTHPSAAQYSVAVLNPFGELISADYGMLDSTAIIEMSLASGLALLRNREDAVSASSFGTGQLIADALGRGATKILLGLGGSASTDGGVGCLQALGVQFLDSQGNSVNRGGIALKDIHKIIPNSELYSLDLKVLCDVDNPTVGESGAAQVFAPQKGANTEQVELLEEGLVHLFELIHSQLGQDVKGLKGGGAAGGTAAGLAALTSARLVPGALTVIEMLDYRTTLKQCDLLITGEGRLDSQTSQGKGPAVIAQLAHDLQIPSIAIAGTIATDLADSPLTAAFSLVPGVIPLCTALCNAYSYLESVSFSIGNVLSLGKGLTV